MTVNIQRVDKSLPLPVYESDGACGFDLLTRVETIIPPKQIALIPANIIVAVPKGFVLVLAPRSSMPKKTGLSFPHSIGVIDQDYSGPEDEIKVQVYNFSDSAVTIKKGEKIAQGMFIKIETPKWKEVSSHSTKSRGGFGSTDKKNGQRKR